MKLISMTDFIMNIEIYNDEREDDFAVTYNYASFLKQPLKLEFFVPCDEEGSVFEEPKTPWQDLIMHEGIHEKYNIKLKEFQTAKEKVLFDGFIVSGKYIELNGTDFLTVNSLENSSIEDLLTWLDNEDEIQLTESAIKRIGL